MALRESTPSGNGRRTNGPSSMIGWVELTQATARINASRAKTMRLMPKGVTRRRAGKWTLLGRRLAAYRGPVARRESILVATIIASQFGPPFMFSGVAVALPQ